MARAGFMVVADHRVDDLVDAAAIRARCVPALESAGLQVHVWPKLVHSDADGMAAARALEGENVDCIIYYIAWFFEANAVVTPALLVPLPAIVWSEPDPHSLSMIGMGVIHGSLEEVGVRHRFIYRPIGPETLAEIAQFAKAAAAHRRLRGARYCQIGGRALSMYTGVADTAQWKSQFGIEVEHMDQWELVLQAERMADGDVREFVRGVRGRFQRVDPDDTVLERSGRVYLALKRIFEQGRYDFVGVKCQFEMIDNYIAPCLPISMLNDEGLVTACEADMNAALSMLVLNSLTGAPAMFADTSFIDRERGMLRLLNCGTAATHFAPSPDAVVLTDCPDEMGSVDPATGGHRTQGGACTHFLCRSGPVTLARFARSSGKYVLQLAEGDVYQPGPDDPTDTFAFDRWPWAFIRLHADMDRFIANVRSNHIHMAYGSWSRHLRDFCELAGVQPILC
jgi:L-fucose isomerase